MAQSKPVKLSKSRTLTSVLEAIPSVIFDKPVKISTLDPITTKFYEIDNTTLPPLVLPHNQFEAETIDLIFGTTFHSIDKVFLPAFHAVDISFQTTIGYLMGSDGDSTDVVYKIEVISLINLENITGIESGALSYFVKINEKMKYESSYERLDDGCIIFNTKQYNTDIVSPPVYRKILRVFMDK